MAIGSEAPIGEKFMTLGDLVLKDGSFDWDRYSRWSAWHVAQMKEHGLMYGYAVTKYIDGHIPSWRRKAGYTRAT